jgi:GDPmannose 4,6-dehydratase
MGEKIKTVLITGITGQDGSYLAEYLLEKGYNVFGLVRRSSSLNYERISHLLERIKVIQGDLLDQNSLIEALKISDPDEVYNLASQSFVPASWSHPAYTGDVNAIGVSRLLDSIRMINPQIKFYQASSSEMFGNPLKIPQDEETPFHPVSPYGIAKLYAHWVTLSYRKQYGIFACSGICFNHESPRRGLEFVSRKITYGASRIKLGFQKELKLGNLEAKRDWGFAGDYVEGMWQIMQEEEPSEYVIATEEVHTVREFCMIAFSHLGLDYRDYVNIDEKFLRPTDINILVGDSSKARNKFGWKPKASFSELVRLMVDSDLKNLSADREKQFLGSPTKESNLKWDRTGA